MSHDETSGPVTRKERRAAYGKRQKTPRQVFAASDYLRPDWTAENLIEMLEGASRGYNGTLRQLLCTGAAKIRDQHAAIKKYEAAIKKYVETSVTGEDAPPAYTDEMAAEDAAEAVNSMINEGGP